MSPEREGYSFVMVNPYLDLTAEFNRGRTRALLSSGQDRAHPVVVARAEGVLPFAPSGVGGT